MTAIPALPPSVPPRSDFGVAFRALQSALIKAPQSS